MPKARAAKAALIPIVQPDILLFPWWWFLLGLNGSMDPYAQWAMATGFRALTTKRGEGEDKSTDVFSFAVELHKPYDKDGLELLLKRRRDLPKSVIKKYLGEVPVDFPSTIGENVDVDVPESFRNRKARFLTLRVDWSRASPEEREHAVAFLLALTWSFGNSRAPAKRIQMGDPRGWDNKDNPNSGLPPDLSAPEGPPNPDAPLGPDGVVMGVIDGDGPFAHAALAVTRGAPNTRVLAVWDQTTIVPIDAPWTPPLGYRYGRQLDNVNMNRALSCYHDGHAVDEAELYADPCVNMPRLSRRSSHGAAVTSLMAGAWRGAPQMPQRPDADGEEVPGGSAHDHPASRAPLIMVQLPVEQTTLSSGRWLAVNALDALRYILDVARGQGDKPAVVVNMSYGAIAGPHDGTGMLEQAIAELVSAYRKEGGDLAVVLADGNTGGVLRDVANDGEVDRGRKHLRVPSGVHAKAAIPRGGKRVFTLFIPPDKQTETHVELWFDRVFGPALDDLGARIVVYPPGTAVGIELVCGGMVTWPPTGEIQAGLMFYSRVAQGEGRSMALLCVAATQVSSTRVSAPAGRWRIEVINDLPRKSRKPLPVEAWVERDDTVIGARRGQSARFVVGSGLAPEGVLPDDANTLTNVSTGNKSFLTGAVFRGPFALDGRAAPYTGTGADDKHGPLLSAVTEAGQALRGIRVSGSQSGMVLRANGTSMAAPQAARWMVKQLADGETLDEIRRKLKRAPRDARVGFIV